MQKSLADTAKSCRVETEETLIKFRPSPNFKKMKKFLKSKIGSTENVKVKVKSKSKSNPHQSPFHGTEHSPTNTSPEPITSLEEQKALLEKAKPAQPPLPLEPPPTTPIDFSLPHKQEIEDHGYQSSLGLPTLGLQETSEVSSLSSATNYDTSQVEASEKQKKTKKRKKTLSGQVKT